MNIFEIVLTGVLKGIKYRSIIKIQDIMYYFMDNGRYLNYYQLDRLKNDLSNLSRFVESEGIKNAVSVFVDNTSYNNAENVIGAIKLFGTIEVVKDGYSAYDTITKQEENARRIAAQQKAIESKEDKNY